jgi:hypothetical protein
MMRLRLAAVATGGRVMNGFLLLMTVRGGSQGHYPLSLHKTLDEALHRLCVVEEEDESAQKQTGHRSRIVNFDGSSRLFTSDHLSGVETMAPGYGRRSRPKCLQEWRKTARFPVAIVRPIAQTTG